MSFACGDVEIIGDRRVPVTPKNDHEFAEFFAAHHRIAIDMTAHVVERGERADVKELAARIAEEQTEQLQILEVALAQVDTEDNNDGDPPPPTPNDPHSEADIAFMRELSGEELDTRFMIDMIAHHAAGLPPAHRATGNLERRDLNSLAIQLFDAQAAEIGEMRAILDSLEVFDAADDLAPLSENRPDIGLVGDRRIPLTPANNVDFLDFFISHHEMAIDMAEDVVERGDDERVQSLAENIQSTQLAELEVMRAVRAEITGSPEPPPMPADPHLDPKVALMSQLSGSTLDRLFLLEMIPHHASGIPTAHRADPHVASPMLRAMADELYQAQAREIGEMHGLLEELRTSADN
jgi:uncharacterized protein (DUF305 family)